MTTASENPRTALWKAVSTSWANWAAGNSSFHAARSAFSLAMPCISTSTVEQMKPTTKMLMLSQILMAMLRCFIPALAGPSPDPQCFHAGELRALADIADGARCAGHMGNHVSARTQTHRHHSLARKYQAAIVNFKRLIGFSKAFAR